MGSKGLRWAPQYGQTTMDEAAAVLGRDAQKALPPSMAVSTTLNFSIESGVKDLNKKWEAQRTAAGATGGIEEAIKKLNADFAEHELRARMAWAASDLKAEVDPAISGLQARVEVAISNFANIRKEGA